MKRLVLPILLVAIVQFVNAQRPNVEFGIKGGINAANFNFDPSQNTDGRLGLHLGLLAHIHLSEHLAIQPEAVISGQGAEYGDDEENKFTYLNIPVLAQVMVGKGFRLQTGPQLGFLMSAKAENGDTEVDIDDNFNKVDFSWAFGASYIFPSNFGLDARYNLGVSNVNENDNVKIRNRVWQFGVFYQFRKRG